MDLQFKRRTMLCAGLNQSPELEATPATRIGVMNCLGFTNEANLLAIIPTFLAADDLAVES